MRLTDDIERDDTKVGIAENDGAHPLRGFTLPRAPHHRTGLLRVRGAGLRRGNGGSWGGGRALCPHACYEGSFGRRAVDGNCTPHLWGVWVGRKEMITTIKLQASSFMKLNGAAELGVV